MLMFGIQVSSSVLESQTVDEGVHIFSGWSYIKNRTIVLNPEHPPLLKILQAAPLLFLNPDLPSEKNQWLGGTLFLYKNHVPADTMLFLGRLVTMILGLILGWFVFQWARETSPLRGLLALFLYAFDSTILAHSRYITTDIGVALFMFLTIYYGKKYFQNPGPRTLFWVSLCFALAQVSKFSSILLLPMLFLLAYSEKNFSAKQFLKMILCMLLMSVAVIEIVYFFQPEAYIIGWKFLLASMSGGHGGFPAYLLGYTDTMGFRWYFPLAFLLKTSPVVLMLVCVGFLANLKNIQKFRFLLMPIGVYMVFSMVSTLNIGIRHLLPIYPFLFVFIAQSVGNIRPATFLLGFYFFESLLTYPFYISYFSPVFGGTHQGYWYLLDSNIDWGQDLKRLATYIKKNNIENLQLLYFGKASPEYYGITAEPISENYKQGYVAISAQILFDPDLNKNYLWLMHYPYTKIGTSLFLYKLP